MTNVKARTEGNRLIIEVDLTERHGRSGSGKTTIIASTGGNKPVSLPNKEGTAFYGLNVYTKE